MAILPMLSLLCAVFALSMATEATTDGDQGETEVQLSESSVLKAVEKRASCEQGWTSHGNRCFKFFSSSLSWSEAEGSCVRIRGHLASIHNINEARFVGGLSGNRAATWIGGGGSSVGFTWYWTDGTAFDYSNWHAFEPNNNRGNEHCIYTNFRDGGVWNDAPCHRQRPFVCAK